jgi:hypothetical protein
VITAEQIRNEASKAFNDVKACDGPANVLQIQAAMAKVQTYQMQCMFEISAQLAALNEQIRNVVKEVQGSNDGQN